MTAPDVDVFLEHHGVKGMKWGKKSLHAVAVAGRETKKAGLSVARGVDKIANFAEQHKAIAIGIGVGALYVGKVLADKRTSHLILKDIRKNPSNINIAKNLLKSKGHVKFSDIQGIKKEQSIKKLKELQKVKKDFSGVGLKSVILLDK